MTGLLVTWQDVFWVSLFYYYLVLNSIEKYRKITAGEETTDYSCYKREIKADAGTTVYSCDNRKTFHIIKCSYEMNQEKYILKIVSVLWTGDMLFLNRKKKVTVYRVVITLPMIIFL